MRCAYCGREITLAQIKAGDYRRVEIETARCEPLYNMPVHVGCGERVLRMIFGTDTAQGEGECNHQAHENNKREAGL